MGKVKGGMKCVKYLLFFFNFMFWLVGSLVLAIGLWLRFDPVTTAIFQTDNSPQTYFLGVYILVGAGGLMMLVGFFGCCGAVRESQCLLGSFFACLLVIFAAEIAASVFGFLNKDKIIDEIQKSYDEAFDAYQKNENQNETLIIYQTSLSCCGKTDMKSDEKFQKTCPENTENMKTCDEAIKNYFKDQFYIIGYVGIGIAGVMIIGMIFSMVLCCAIRNSRDVI
ncbi:tetraspanin-2a [Polypterus senegalus]|uniref:tetraspanin-2a n=1 Tax=Polypterus senegalus TaxID=55291 RepID=UPI001964EE45|nr:tetraspanin-2a [Polypterus senegalus]